jgi:hypothetical protein
MPNSRVGKTKELRSGLSSKVLHGRCTFAAALLGATLLTPVLAEKASAEQLNNLQDKQDDIETQLYRLSVLNPNLNEL